MANRVVRIESEVFVGVGRFSRHLSLNYPEPVWTHLNQEKANVYPFHAFKDPESFVLSADKSNYVVVMDKQQYHDSSFMKAKCKPGNHQISGCVT